MADARQAVGLERSAPRVHFIPVSPECRTSKRPPFQPLDLLVTGDSNPQALNKGPGMGILVGCKKGIPYLRVIDKTLIIVNKLICPGDIALVDAPVSGNQFAFRREAVLKFNIPVILLIPCVLLNTCIRPAAQVPDIFVSHPANEPQIPENAIDLYAANLTLIRGSIPACEHAVNILFRRKVFPPFGNQINDPSDGITPI